MGCLETKIRAYNAKKMKKSLGSRWTTVVKYSTLLDGRIWVVCNDLKMEATILNTTTQLVHFKIRDKDSLFSYVVTSIYGFNTDADSMGLQDYFRVLSTSFHETWLIIKDFNVVLSHEDQVNGNQWNLMRQQVFKIIQKALMWGKYLEEIGNLIGAT